MAEEENLQSSPVESSTPEATEAAAPVPSENPKAEEVAPVPVKTSTAQIPPNEPLPPQNEPLTPAPEVQTAQPTPPSTPTPALQSHQRDLATKARAVIQTRKRKKLERILEEITKRGSITNDEVEKLLHVSDATATRYLQQLENEGKIQQVGRTGHAVKYTKTLR